MSFGSFLVDAGYAAQGATDMRRDLNANRASDQQAAERARMQAMQDADMQNQAAAHAALKASTNATLQNGMEGVQGYAVGGGQQPHVPAGPQPTPVPPAVEYKDAAPLAAIGAINSADNYGYTRLNNMRTVDRENAKTSALGTPYDDTSGAQKAELKQINANSDDASRIFDTALKKKLNGKPNLAPAAPNADPALTALAQKYGVDPRLVASIYQQESGSGKNTKTSDKGAVGSMQVTPDTYATLRANGLNPSLDLNNPTHGLEIGVANLAYLQKKLGTTDPNALAQAYFSGPGGVGKNFSDGRVNTNDYAAQVTSRMGAPGTPATPGQPAQTAQAPQVQPEYALPQLTPQQDSYAAALRQKQYAAQVQILNTVNPRTPQGFAMVQQAKANIEQLQLGEFGHATLRLSQAAASGDPQALTKLAEVYRRETGAQVQIQPGPNGQFALVGMDRRPVMVGTAGEIASHLYKNVDERIIQRTIEIAQAAQLEGMKAGAKANAELPSKLAVIDAETSGKILATAAELGIKRNEVKSVNVDPVAARFAIVTKNDGSVVHIPMPDDAGKPGLRPPIKGASVQMPPQG